MKARSSFLVIAAATLVIAGCSHGTISDTPTAPTPPAVTIKLLTITPSGGGTMIVGQSAPITSSGTVPAGGPVVGAFADYTDGTGKYIAATWTSSDPAVAVAADSSLRAIGRGTAVLTASAEGHSASVTFVVEPGIPGTWAGTYVVDQCAAGSGSMQELICSALPGRTPALLAVGTVAPINFLVSQTGTALTATAAFGNVRGTLTGTDRGVNFLTLTGNLTADSTTITVVHWDSHVKTDLMEGFITFEVRVAGLPSHAQVAGHFVDVTRR